jgi:hypothetical protein
VGRILAATQLGLPPEEVVSYIEVGSGKALGKSAFDGAITLSTQATTYGPLFSKDLQRSFERTVAGIPKEQWVEKHFKAALSLARADGANVDEWLRGRMLMTVLASVAEAMHTGRPVSEVWNSPESEGDFAGAVADGLRGGLGIEQIKQFINEAIVRAEALVMQSNVRRAIYELADAIPSVGRMSGRSVYKIVARALAE